MSAPNNQEYGTASAAAYTLTQSSGFILPPGWSIVQESSRAQRSDGGRERLDDVQQPRSGREYEQLCSIG